MALDYSQFLNRGPSPIEKAMAGYQQGLAQRQQREQAEVAKQQALQAQERKAGIQQELAALASNPNKTARDYANLTTKYPELAQSLKWQAGVIGEERVKDNMRTAQQIDAALSVGRNDVAEKIMEDRITSFESAGNKQEADINKVLLMQLKANPEAAKETIALSLAVNMQPDQFIDYMGARGGAERQKALLPIEIKSKQKELELTGAQVAKALKDADKLDAETQKTILELEAMKSGKIPQDPEKTFKMENDLRKDFNKNSEGFRESRRNIGVISDSAKDKSGAGDLSLVTSFMKMLDPGSVVRETEFANARNTAGLLRSLKAKSEQIKNGQFLDSDQRNDFVRLAQKYFNAAEKEQGRLKNSMQPIIKRYNLDENSIFGVEETAEAVETPEGAAVQTTQTEVVGDIPENLKGFLK